jgi:hypothetical protein
MGPRALGSRKEHNFRNISSIQRVELQPLAHAALMPMQVIQFTIPNQHLPQLPAPEATGAAMRLRSRVAGIYAVESV